jgi:threonine/homoserine/homoserine lactone efflux protein
MDPTVFAFAVLAVLATPGPTNTLMAVAGATLGISRGLKLIPAEVAGYLASISILAFIFHPFVAAFPFAAAVLRVGCGLYLAVLALNMWRTSATEAAQADLVDFQRVFTTTLLNPKSLIFAFQIFPTGGPPLVLAAFGTFALICTAAATMWICLGAMLGSRTRAFVSDTGIRRVTAIVLGLFAVLFFASTVAK